MSGTHNVEDVIFRVWNIGYKDCIAIFPGILGTTQADTCQSYEHVGQHGAASTRITNGLTRPAKPEEYADLKRELESNPYYYQLRVVKRFTRAHRKDRESQMAPFCRGV